MAHVYVNKTTGGVKVGYVGRHLQLLWWKITWKITGMKSKNEDKKRQVNNPGYYVRSPIQVATSARSSSTWLMSISCDDTQANVNAVCHRHPT